MTTKELRTEVRRFIKHNQDRHTQPALWPEHWRRWCAQIERRILERKRREVTGDPMPGIEEGIANALKRTAETPCYQRIGGGRDPHKDPTGFVRSGCSLFGACNCTKEKRQEIVDALSKDAA